MEELKKIETGMVPVYETSTGEKVVYGSDLHRVLEVKSNYRDWAKNRLKDIDAVENEDYKSDKILAPSGQSKLEHIIRLDIAKEMSMLERNEKGKQVRRYFIELERRLWKRNIVILYEIFSDIAQILQNSILSFLIFSLSHHIMLKGRVENIHAI